MGKRDRRLPLYTMCIGIILIMLVAYNIYTRSYFRFENFKKGEKLIEYLNKKFPIGSNPDDAVILLKRAGAKCTEIGKPFHYTVPKNTKEEWFCEYSHWEVSFDLHVRFTIEVYADKNNQIIRFGVGRHPDLL